MKILLLGGTGLLGGYFQAVFRTQSIDYLAPPREEFDILDHQKMVSFFRDHPLEEFKLILHCAAYTNVEKAESDKRNCEAVNVQGLKNLLQYKLPIIHFSTDYVFGNFPKKTPIKENFPRFPINSYGDTKLHAEKLLERYDKPWWNIRTTWLFGGGKCFVTRILQKSLVPAVQKMGIINDQIGRPTYAKDLAEFVTAHFILQTKDKGHYHAQNTGPITTWAQFADYFLGEFYRDTPEQKPVIIGEESENFPLQAERPKNSVLENTRLKHNLRDWREAVKEFLTRVKISKPIIKN